MSFLGNLKAVCHNVYELWKKFCHRAEKFLQGQFLANQQRDWVVCINDILALKFHLSKAALSKLLGLDMMNCLSDLEFFDVGLLEN